MSRAIIILGMHRSGTSALAGSLEEKGVYLGDVNSHSPDNVKGNRESRNILTLNEDILNASDGSWDAPVTNLVWSPLHKVTRNLIVDSFKGKPIWGFKDPRTILVLDGWLQAVPNAELVCIFRHPFLVADSLFRRSAMCYAKGLKLWITYNRILKWHLDRNERTFIVEFSGCKNVFEKQLNSLLVDLELSAGVSSFYNSDLKQSIIPNLHEQPNSTEALSLYTNLQKYTLNNF